MPKTMGHQRQEENREPVTVSEMVPKPLNFPSCFTTSVLASTIPIIVCFEFRPFYGFTPPSFMYT